MLVRQFAKFVIMSLLAEPDAITAAVDLVPDDTNVMGSRYPGPPPVPRSHIWTLKSGCPEDIPLQAHFEALVARLTPRVDQLRDFLTASDADAGFTIVRMFEPGAESDSVVDESNRNLGDAVRVAGQHPLLGFWLGGEILQMAAYLGVGFDFDEYGDEDE